VSAREVDEALRRLDAQARSLELGHEQLVNQMAELAIQQANMGKQIEEAMERALEKAFDRFLDRMQSKAAEHTGRWFWRAVKAAASRWLLIAFIVVTVGKMAGWQFAVAVFDAIMGKGK
jgi:hypothetical protein